MLGMLLRKISDVCRQILVKGGLATSRGHDKLRECIWTT